MWWHLQSHNAIKVGIIHFFTDCQQVLQQSRMHLPLKYSRCKYRFVWLYLLWFSCRAAKSALDFSGDMFLKVSNIVSKSSRQQDLNFCLLHFKFLMTPLYHILALGTTDAIKFRLSCDSDETRHIVWGEFRFCHLYCSHSSFVIRQIIYIAVTRHSWFAKSCTWLPIGNIDDEVQAASGYCISFDIRIMVIPCQAHSKS